MNRDSKIIHKIKLKDEDGISILLDDYGDLLKSVIARHLYSLINYKEECLNDVLLEIWNHIDSYNFEKSSFKNWICAIARYRSLNYVRKYSHNIKVADLEDEDIISNENIGEELVIREDIEEFLSGLNPTDREIFYRIFYEGQTVREFSLEKNISENSVHKRISRVRKNIRRGKDEI